MAKGRRDRLLPWIAGERAIRGVLLLVVGVYLLAHSGASLSSLLGRFAKTLELDPSRGFVHHALDKIANLGRNEIVLFGVGALAYGALELVEGVGLWLRKRWAEWLTVVATSLLVPFEIYELVTKPSWLKAAGLAVNVLIVIYLLKVVREPRE